ncbi:phosphohydrolase [Acinetobacter sp. ANC 4470]|uniref:HD domain-containing protein n=1 Tax=Acinetobacter sp. ANC 4470 TaxID=1977881 RepID=UPI000A3424D6|nr:HD domain-containing protein [Acinetobacter sp. ANC 4470]OTG62950.1 phosphohydrolase [Acinetobacter sp. ANC 4470]
MSHTKIGTYSWMNKTNGKISFKEKIKLFNKLIIPNLLTPIKENIYKNHSDININFHVNQVIIPDTKMIEIAVEELESKASISIINHSWRTYFWGAALGHLQNKPFDPESLLTASLFHDIGLTTPHLETKGCKCFTYESADQFSYRAQEINFDEDKTQLIKDAICIHMNGYIDQSYPSEIQLLQQGASCDVIGEQLHNLPSNFKNQIIEKYPRENFNKNFIELIKAESKNNPNSRTAFLKSLGLPLMIHLNPFRN